ncbi:MAG: transposase [Ignavibacteria bacterium]|nr:transposase [Ignavibacteria bacterium]
MATTTSFKIQVRELTREKKLWLKERIQEYARIYNEAPKFVPSLPDRYLKSANPSELYTQWIKGDDGTQLLHSSILSGIQTFNALKDACANWKTIKVSKQKARIQHIDTPNIIKFENSEYQLIRLGKGYAVHVSGKEGITLPLITNSEKNEARRKVLGKDWGVRAHLDNGIRMQAGKKERNKHLAEIRKDNPDKKREKKVKAGLGVITFNLRDNTVSIPHTIESPRFQKKGTRNTFIGVDRGVRNSVVLSAIYIDPKKSEGLREYFELFDDELITIKKEIFGSLKGLGAKVVGVKIIKSAFMNDKKRHLKTIAQKRQEKQKKPGDRYKNVSETVAHQISAEAVEFVNQFRNPVVFFEDLNMEKKKRRHKFGKKNTKNSRRMLSKWDYGSIRRKMEYKLNAHGIWTMGINPMFTSQICNHCGAIGIRDGIGFKCERCGLGVGSSPAGTMGQYNADVNASINIALKGLFSLYGRKAGVVADPIEQPDENVQKPIPISEITELVAVTGIEGIKTRRSETVAVCPANAGAVETNVSRSILCGSVQPMVEVHQAGSAPENGFSSCYKQKNNFGGRTELEEKTAMREVVSQTEFSRM